MASKATPLPWFPRAVGFCYLCNFYSWLLDFDLFSSRGILPYQVVAARGEPTPFSLQAVMASQKYGDFAMMALLLIGTIYAARVVIGEKKGAAFALLVCFGCSSSICEAAQVFGRFQWDSLLKEGGVLALFYCLADGAKPARLLVTWLLFKLMFMSGVVKIFSGCPTWLELTATSFHFATQPLPNALAWWAHQLPIVIHKWLVAVTLWGEIAAPFLLLVPLCSIRRVGVALQILLQVTIASTGSYNFFNLLTTALCLPAWHCDPSRLTLPGKRWQGSFLGCAAFIGWSFYAMFQVSSMDLIPALKLKEEACHALVRSLLPPTTAFFFGWLALSSAEWVLHGRGAVVQALRLAGSGAVLLLFALGSVPMAHQLDPKGPLIANSPSWLLSAFNELAPRGVFNGYGLFRHMTGVDMTPEGKMVVQRPEILLFGSKDGVDWKQLHFRFKPGDFAAMPSYAAPHQPHLDWQMWFAALGNSNLQPWLVHLIYQLQHGCSQAIELLDKSRYPFEEGHALGFVKLELWKTDFTAIEDADSSNWWQGHKERDLIMFELGNEELLEFLHGQGFAKGEACGGGGGGVGRWTVAQRKVAAALVVMVLVVKALGGTKRMKGREKEKTS